MMRIIKGCSIGLLILIKAFLLLVGYLYIASGQSAEYIQRTILWGQSDIYDYQRFPERAIQNAPPVSDFDKIGQLFLNRGTWNGQQIISEAWVDEATSRDPGDRRAWVSFPNYRERFDGYYKYHWWGIASDGHDDFMARGHLGQIIYICPEKQLVIVRYGSEEGPSVDWSEIMLNIERSLDKST